MPHLTDDSHLSSTGMALAMTSTAKSISSSVATSGGSSLITSPAPAVRISSPASLHAPTMAPAGQSSCTPTSRPDPRTSCTCLLSFRASRSPLLSCSPRAVTFARNLSSDTLSKTALAALHTKGPPAKVDPWSPGAMASATSWVHRIAPMGRPPARGLATVMISGVTPTDWWPQR